MHRRPRIALLAVAILGVACTSPVVGPAGPPSSAGPPAQGMGPGLSVADALRSTLDQPLLVNGMLHVQRGEVRLCTALLESYPPQCGVPSIVVRGLNLTHVAGLTENQGIQWTSRPIQLLGRVKNGILEVSPGASG